MLMMIMVMNCSYGTVEWPKYLNLITSWNHYQEFSLQTHYILHVKSLRNSLEALYSNFQRNFLLAFWSFNSCSLWNHHNLQHGLMISAVVLLSVLIILHAVLNLIGIQKCDNWFDLWVLICCQRQSRVKRCLVNFIVGKMIFRWGTHLSMSLFSSVSLCVCPLRTISQEPYIIWS